MIDYEDTSMEELRFWESTIASLIDKNQDIQRSNAPTSLAWQQASDRLRHLFPAMSRLTSFIKTEEYYGRLSFLEDFIEFHCAEDRNLANAMYTSAIAFFESTPDKD